MQATPSSSGRLPMTPDFIRQGVRLAVATAGKGPLKSTTSADSKVKGVNFAIRNGAVQRLNATCRDKLLAREQCTLQSWNAFAYTRSRRSPTVMPNSLKTGPGARAIQN